MAKKSQTFDEERIEFLEDAHGKKWIKLSELECKMMRLNGIIETNKDREGIWEPLQETMLKVEKKRDELLLDIGVILGDLKRLRVDTPENVTQRVLDGQLGFNLA